MNDNFMNLLRQLNLDEKTDVYHGDLIDIEADGESHVWLFNVEFDAPLEIDDFVLFHQQIVDLPKRIQSIQKADLRVS